MVIGGQIFQVISVIFSLTLFFTSTTIIIISNVLKYHYHAVGIRKKNEKEYIIATIAFIFLIGVEKKWKSGNYYIFLR